MPATTMRPLTSEHPKIEQFLRLWHENGRAQFQRSSPHTTTTPRSGKLPGTGGNTYC